MHMSGLRYYTIYLHAFEPKPHAGYGFERTSMVTVSSVALQSTLIIPSEEIGTVTADTKPRSLGIEENTQLRYFSFYDT
jgi:hypothetical protein